MLLHCLWLWEWKALYFFAQVPLKLFIEEKRISAVP